LDATFLKLKLLEFKSSLTFPTYSRATFSSKRCTKRILHWHAYFLRKNLFPKMVFSCGLFQLLDLVSLSIVGMLCVGFRFVVQVNLAVRIPRQVWLVKIEGVLVLLPKNRRINNIFQSFIAPKTKIKLQKTANTGQ